MKIGFLQVVWARMFLPSAVEVSLSEDGETFATLGTAVHDAAADDSDGPATLLRRDRRTGEERDGQRTFRPGRAVNLGRAPPDHERSGEPAWLYADEIIVD